mmetsp:Transcript_16643/g.14522  ORF Transcript_16643/g.14522 Transcript_16643/m.14522 type:complete len:113 (-) Transcript_16643:3128-3466(-)
MNVAVDFTSSNGDPRVPKSLHSFTNANGAPNEYQKALANIGNILLKYNKSKLIASYGFGAKPNYPNLSSQQVSHCFPLTGVEENPCVKGLQALLDTYKFSVFSTQMWGPTVF